MDIALIFIAFLVAALIFWAVAELRYKNFNYKEKIVIQFTKNKK